MFIVFALVYNVAQLFCGLIDEERYVSIDSCLFNLVARPVSIVLAFIHDVARFRTLYGPTFLVDREELLGI